MKPLGRAMQIIENKKKEVFAGLDKVNMTDEQLKQFCSLFLGEDTDNFLMMCDKIEAEEGKGFVFKQKKIMGLWMGFIGYKLMDLNFLNEINTKLKEFKKNKKNKPK